jgi:hypothetical protein
VAKQRGEQQAGSDIVWIMVQLPAEQNFGFLPMSLQVGGLGVCQKVGLPGHRLGAIRDQQQIWNLPPTGPTTE